MEDTEVFFGQLERLAIVLDEIMPGCATLVRDALKLLKEQKNLKGKLLQKIADNQLANAPSEWMNETQRTYSHGVWDGLQMAYEIINQDT